MIEKPIRYGCQNITQDDINEVVNVLKSDWLTQGPKIKEFEENFAKYVGSKFAVAVSNGTAALHISTMTLGVNSNSRVITTPITFVATANSVKFCGGEVYFADIDPKTYLLDIHKVRELIEKHPKGFFQGIIPVDFAGRAVNLEEYRKLADEHGLWLIEDACHAPGGYFIDSKGNQQNCGNGNFADLAIFSFHPVKHIACGEGGMITTNDEKLYKKLLTFRSHGITSSQSEFKNDLNTALVGNKEQIKQAEELGYPGWYMEMQNLGYNYRITDIQAALGVSQLKRANEGIIKRREIAKFYQQNFQNKDFLIGQSGDIEGHAYHLYVLEVKDRLSLFNEFYAKNIAVQIHYYPAHLMPYYNKNYKLGDFPNAEKYYTNCVSIPIFPTLTEENRSYVVETVEKFYNAG